ncbi:hypothetical protein AB0875_26350 [Micromonospora gifhornensis]|uniref:hypothetical protein n=1 Tax=Micromonospora gifhornensis TaxID=84594 RepID=UPI0034540AE0
MKQVPLAGKVVFVDWHSVLSRDPFWMSIRESATHPLKAQLEANLAEVFKNKANEWMKGLLSSEEIINSMDIELDGRFREDFLTRRLYVDCAKMRVNAELFEALRKIKSHVLVVLATDNMDCFLQTFDRARAKRRRPTSQSETLADWAIILDDIICSSEVAALKAEDPQRFFGPWLAEHGLTFADAALIDDRADNCAAFTEQGGKAVQYKMGIGDVHDVYDDLIRWFNSGSVASAQLTSWTTNMLGTN